MTAQPQADDVEGATAAQTGPSEMLGAASPFDDGGVDGLFFPGGERQTVMDGLLHMLRYGPSLLLLYGDEGVGKRYLVQQLLATLDEELFDVALLKADVLMSAPVLLSALEVPWHCRTPLQLDQYGAQLAECGAAADNASRVLLLIVYQSQLLDADCVDVLSTILASCAGLPVKLLLVLDGDEPEAHSQLQVLFDRVPDHYQQQLVPLTQSDTVQYLAYRLRTGGLGRAHFSDAQVAHIFNLSLGNIRRINEVAAEVLLTAMAVRSEQGKRPAMPWMHVGALAVVAVVLIALWASGPAEHNRVATLVEQKPEDVVAVAPVVAPAKAAPAAEMSEREAPVTASPGLDAKVAVATAGDEGGERPEETSAVPVTAPVEVKPEAPQPAPKPAAASSAPKPKPVEPQKPVKPAASTVDSRTAWMLSLSPERYAIQLLGAKEKASVDKFLTMYPSVQNLTYYKSQRNGADWFVVVQASFADYDSAQAAVAKLPQKLQKQGPWIRKIEAIQKDLKN